MANDLSLYIHIPFCKTICLYCNFVTFAHKNKQIPDYIDVVLSEIEKKSSLYKKNSIQTIYFGGGTPSLIDPEFIGKILEKIAENYRVKKNLEMSIECNPESLDAERLSKYKEYGVTRISLGIQSFSKKTLLRIARPHDSKTIFKALGVIKNSGFKNFGADFIMGLPYQTLSSFKEEVEVILSYQPAHLSFYFLSYDTKKIDLFINDSPNEEIQITMYEYLVKRLAKAGYQHYEVSNFAKPGFECLHNVRYWQQKDYLGFGLGAHSIVNNMMWENTSNFEEYLKNPLIKKEEMPIDNELKRMEYIMLHLRTICGINVQEYEKKFGKSGVLLKNAKSYFRSGHLKQKDGVLYASEKGFLIIDSITKALL